MTDTTIEMQNMQREIFARKSIKERFLIGSEMIDFGRKLVINNIQKLNPAISDIDLKIAIIKRYYESSFSREEFALIIQSLLNFEKNKISE